MCRSADVGARWCVAALHRWNGRHSHPSRALALLVRPTPSSPHYTLLGFRVSFLCGVKQLTPAQALSARSQFCARGRATAARLLRRISQKLAFCKLAIHVWPSSLLCVCSGITKNAFSHGFGLLLRADHTNFDTGCLKSVLRMGSRACRALAVQDFATSWQQGIPT